MDIRTYEYISHYSGNIFQLADKKGSNLYGRKEKGYGIY